MRKRKKPAGRKKKKERKRPWRNSGQHLAAALPLQVACTVKNEGQNKKKGTGKKKKGGMEGRKENPTGPGHRGGRATPFDHEYPTTQFQKERRKEGKRGESWREGKGGKGRKRDAYLHFFLTHRPDRPGQTGEKGRGKKKNGKEEKRKIRRRPSLTLRHRGRLHGGKRRREEKKKTLEEKGKERGERKKEDLRGVPGLSISCCLSYISPRRKEEGEEDGRKEKKEKREEVATLCAFDRLLLLAPIANILHDRNGERKKGRRKRVPKEKGRRGGGTRHYTVALSTTSLPFSIIFLRQHQVPPV